MVIVMMALGGLIFSVMTMEMIALIVENLVTLMVSVMEQVQEALMEVLMEALMEDKESAQMVMC
jgi:hypothetical protein